MQETQLRFLGLVDPLEEETATHSSTLAWKIPWTEEPGRLQSTESQRVKRNWGHMQYIRSRELLFKRCKNKWGWDCSCGKQKGNCHLKDQDRTHWEGRIWVNASEKTNHVKYRYWAFQAEGTDGTKTLHWSRPGCLRNSIEINMARMEWTKERSVRGEKGLRLDPGGPWKPLQALWDFSLSKHENSYWDILRTLVIRYQLGPPSPHALLQPNPADFLTKGFIKTTHRFIQNDNLCYAVNYKLFTKQLI